MPSGGNNIASSRPISNFESAESVQSHGKAMFRFINVISELSFPVSYVENESFLEYGDVDINISVRAVSETVFKLVELVEIGIRNDTKVSSGAVMLDG